jgi:hypothetical protein
MDRANALAQGFTMQEILAEEARRADPTGMMKYARPVVEGLGMVGGSLLGSAGGPVGTVAGGALGYAGSKRLLDMISGTAPQGLIPSITGAVQDVGTGGLLEMGGQALGPALGLLAKGGRAVGQGLSNIPRALGEMGQISGIAPTGRNAATAAARTPPFQPGEARVFEGYLTPQEAAAAKLPMSAGDVRLLGARTAEERAVAEQMKTAEALRATDKLGVIGGNLSKIESDKLAWGTDFLKQQLGITGNATLTPATVGKLFTKLGGQFDDYAKQVGAIPYGQTEKAAFDAVLSQAEGGHASMLATMAKRLEEAAMVNKGVIPPKVWSSIRHDLGTTIKSAGGQGNYAKLYDAAEMQTVLDDMLHAAASPEAQAAITETRKQYGIIKTALSRDSGINASGDVNPATFFNAYMKKSPGRYMNFENDPVARTFGTLNFLTKKYVPSSGTAERLLANPGRAAIKTGEMATKAGLGLLGLKTGWNMLE